MSDEEQLYESMLKDIRIRKIKQKKATSRLDDIRVQEREKETSDGETDELDVEWGSRAFSKLDEIGKKGEIEAKNKKRASVISSVENLEKLEDYLDYFEDLVLKASSSSLSNDMKDLDAEDIVIEPEDILTEDDFGLNKQTYVMKIILIGDGAVGKTSIRRNYLGKSFRKDYYMTIGADFAIKDVELSSGETVKYQIWDLAGQPHFKGVRTSYYSSCFGAMVVFDLTRPKTFSNAILWINELWKANGRGPIPVIFLGNKFDLVKKNTPVIEQAFRFCQTFSENTYKWKGFVTPFMITSAKTGLNIERGFDVLGQSIFSWLKNMKNETDEG